MSVLHWLATLKNRQARAMILVRVGRLRLGNFRDSRSVGGGVHELRIDYGRDIGSTLAGKGQP